MTEFLFFGMLCGLGVTAIMEGQIQILRYDVQKLEEKIREIEKGEAKGRNS